ncbi:uncharacterized protein EI90DRAFT_3285674 [Cantharellus anzutake]|uniref:uncharacterized protein n=1 Tax=Cantharellus anzutake TaxID=1750568 RepID=UPI001906E9A6|nr:uncharacterized protein EI90DRAFT_3285674 [Cantharellus anzutake]KAF8341605.1 hypothetical protein EI90DRAFT_3285674 [Cantharellus anzutake]
MAKSIHSEFAEAEVGKHVSAHTLSPPTLHIMPLGKKRKRANNLGKYSQKKLHVDPSPTTESIHTIPLEHTQTVGDDVLPDWPDANVNSNSYDGANSDADSDTDLDETINPAISSKNAFSQCLHDTEEQLAQLANIQGKIPGNKVTYAGTTILYQHDQLPVTRHAGSQLAFHDQGRREPKQPHQAQPFSRN